MTHLVAEYRRLEQNLMSATDDNVLVAIKTRMDRLASEIANFAA